MFILHTFIGNCLPSHSLAFPRILQALPTRHHNLIPSLLKYLGVVIFLHFYSLMFTLYTFIGNYLPSHSLAFPRILQALPAGHHNLIPSFHKYLGVVIFLHSFSFMFTLHKFIGNYSVILWTFPLP